MVLSSKVFRYDKFSSEVIMVLVTRVLNDVFLVNYKRVLYSYWERFHFLMDVLLNEPILVYLFAEI